MSPPPIKRPGSSPRLSVTEINVATGPHEYTGARRPNPTNPPPPEYVSPLPEKRMRQPSYHDEPEPPQRMSRIDLDPETMRSAPHSVSIPLVLITTVITAGASVLGTWFATRSAAVTPNCATKDDVALVSREQEVLATGFTALTEKVNQVEDRTHNDLSLLSLKMDVLTKQK